MATLTSTGDGDWWVGYIWGGDPPEYTEPPVDGDLVYIDHAVDISYWEYASSDTLTIVIRSGGKLTLNPIATGDDPTLNITIEPGGEMDVQGQWPTVTVDVAGGKLTFARLGGTDGQVDVMWYSTHADSLIVFDAEDYMILNGAYGPGTVEIVVGYPETGGDATLPDVYLFTLGSLAVLASEGSHTLTVDTLTQTGGAINLTGGILRVEEELVQSGDAWLYWSASFDYAYFPHVVLAAGAIWRIQALTLDITEALEINRESSTAQVRIEGTLTPYNDGLSWAFLDDYTTPVVVLAGSAAKIVYGSTPQFAIASDVVPTIANVRSGTAYDGGLKTGTLNLPAIANVRDGTTFDGATKTGTLDLPAEADVKEGVEYDGATKTGTLEVGSGGAGMASIYGNAEIYG